MDNSAILHHEIDDYSRGVKATCSVTMPRNSVNAFFPHPPRVSRKDFQNEYVGDKSSGETLQALTKIFMTQSLCLWVWGDKRSLRNLSKF